MASADALLSGLITAGQRIEEPSWNGLRDSWTNKALSFALLPVELLIDDPEGVLDHGVHTDIGLLQPLERAPAGMSRGFADCC